MTAIAMRIVCAAMSTMGAAGLVVFVDPANTAPKAANAAAPAVVAATAVLPAVRRG